MKNLPSFSEFSNHADFIDPIDESTLYEFSQLQRAQSSFSVNESSLLNSVKNQISKFFLGSFSRLNMIDEARTIILDLKIDLLEQEDEFETKIDAIEKEISTASKEQNNESKLDSLKKKREILIREIEAFKKSQDLKIKKSKDVARKLADGNKRRLEYLEAGLAEDEITIAEFEYKMAKKKIKDLNKLSQLEQKIKDAKEEAAIKAEKIKDETDADSSKQKTSPTDYILDPEEEKKKIIGKKPLDIISYKNKLEKEIADLRSEIEKKIVLLEKKIKKGSGGLSQNVLQNLRLQFIELTEELDCKINILRRVRGLGKTEWEIKKSTDTGSELSALSNKINQDIKDGQDEKTGTKKIISDLFITSGGNIAITPEGIEKAKKKLNN
jgi:hypothetical protein